MTINDLVKTRPYRYKTEAFIRVIDAFGMRRPNEVAMIHYDSPESGERFRGNTNNDDIMRLISQFNEDHVTQARYFIAHSNR